MIKRGLIGALSIILLVVWTMPCMAAPIENADRELSTELSEEPIFKTDKVSTTAINYEAYRAENADQPNADTIIELSFSDWRVEHSQNTQAMTHDSEENQQAVLLKSGGASAYWEFSVEKTGWYYLSITYRTVEGNGRNIDLAVLLDGVEPFDGCNRFSLSRCFEDHLTDGEMPRDAVGNEIQPEQSEVFRRETVTLTSADGSYTQPYMFYLSAGMHSLVLKTASEPVSIGMIRFCPPTQAQNYTAPTGVIPHQKTEMVTVVQAEKPVLKSDEVLHPVYDRSDVANVPSDPYYIRLNTIGGNGWNQTGQWIEWEFSVPKDDYYQIGTRFRQKESQGLASSRRLLIDGECPFAECESIEFPYGLDWQTDWFGGEKPYYFYLSKGIHTLRLEVTTGKVASTTRRLSQVVDRLNAMYRKIIMITSVQPDASRDYNVHQQIPELLSVLESQAKNILECADELGDSRAADMQAATLKRMAERLETFVKKPYTIPERLSAFREDLSSLSSFLLDLRAQPLELDYLFVGVPGTKLPRASANFFKQLWNELRGFYASFVMDYDQIGATDAEKSLDVWMNVGREQANQLRRQIDSDFVKKTGSSVRLRLVTAGLVQAIMAGEEPDVSLNVGRTDPLNLWLRGALTELQDMDGLDELKTQFAPTAFSPYMTGDALYALPETQTFDMMFYRTDIFDELNIAPPETWEDLYKVSQVIQHANLEVGLPSTYTLFGALLMQNGGRFLDEENKYLTTDSAIGQKAFKEWTDFYLEYSFPLNKSEYNRFRTGEMPLVITSYALYCQLTATAPDIQGLWKMCPVPGIRQEDGSICRYEVGGGTSCVMLKGTDKKQEAWEFMKWWVSADTQAQYGRGIEILLGEAARYTPANRQALAHLYWGVNETEQLQSQWDYVIDLPEVPGGYYISRNLDNAFRACVYKFSDTREMLNYWTYETNKEIQRKRQEFHLGS